MKGILHGVDKAIEEFEKQKVRGNNRNKKVAANDDGDRIFVYQ